MSRRVPLHLIVAVDDEPTLRDVYLDLLQDEGYRVILCTTIRPTAIQPPEELQTSPVAILPKPFGVDDLLGAIQTALAL